MWVSKDMVGTFTALPGTIRFSCMEINVHLTIQQITAVFQDFPTYFSNLDPSISDFGYLTSATCNISIFILMQHCLMLLKQKFACESVEFG